MKTTLKSSALQNTPSGPLMHKPSKPTLEFGAGFRQFLSSFPEEPEPSMLTPPVRQPLRYLEATPAIDDCQFASASSSAYSVEDSLSRSLGAAIFLAARPTTKAMSLAGAVHTMRTA